jgi:hypothetical protein
MRYIKKYAYLPFTHPASSPSIFSSTNISNSSHSPHPSRCCFPPLCSFSSFFLMFFSFFHILYFYRRFHNPFPLFHFTFLNRFYISPFLFALFTFQLVVYVCGPTEHKCFNVERNTKYGFMDLRHLRHLNMNM